MSTEPMSMGALILHRLIEGNRRAAEKWLDTLPTGELYALATTCRDMANCVDEARDRRIPGGDR